MHARQNRRHGRSEALVGQVAHPPSEGLESEGIGDDLLLHGSVRSGAEKGRHGPKKEGPRTTKLSGGRRPIGGFEVRGGLGIVVQRLFERVLSRQVVPVPKQMGSSDRVPDGQF